MKKKESVTALVFLVVTAVLSVFCLVGMLDAVYVSEDAPSAADLQVEPDQAETPVQQAERQLNTLLDRNHLFIQLYGGVQRLAGRRVMEDVEPSYTVVKLSDGSLTFTRDSLPDPGLQEQVFTTLRDALAQQDTPLLYVQAPNKLAPGDDRLPVGVEDYSNDYADGLLDMLAGLNIDTMDLRPVFQQAEGDWGDWFFSTDHHWTPEGAFLACQALCDVLRAEYGFSIDDRVTDPESYTKTVYEDWFLGSQGKRVGSLYGGTDDIAVWTPDFRTLLNYTVYSQGIDRTGSFANTVLFYERLQQKDWFSGNPYTLYSGGDYPMGRISNYFNPDGPRILLVRDSYACAMTPFLALGCSELSTFDLRYFGKDDRLLDYIAWLKPDLVICMYSAGQLHLDELLQFGPVTVTR